MTAVLVMAYQMGMIWSSCFVLFYDVSNLVGYLMPDSVYVYIFLFILRPTTG